MRRLATSGVVTAGVFYAVHRWGENVPNMDRVILAGIGIVFGLAAAIMLAGTPRWSARALGILYTSLATFVLYGIGLTYYGWYRGVPLPNWVIDLGRSLFIVGGPMLAYGLLVWLHVNWGPPGRVGERRQMVRRQEDRDRDELIQKYETKYGNLEGTAD